MKIRWRLNRSDGNDLGLGCLFVALLAVILLVLWLKA